MCCWEPVENSLVGGLESKLGNMTIRVLAESKLNTIADRISIALTDDKISEEDFRLILSEVDKYDQMKAEIRRGRQTINKQLRRTGGGLAENEKKQLMNLMIDEAMLTARTKLLKSSELLETVAALDKYILFAGLKKERRLVRTLWAADEFIKWKH